MNNQKRIFVDLPTLKKEAKTIYKKNKKVIEYTKILNILITHLNFESYNKYKINIHKPHENVFFKNTIGLDNTPIYKLPEIENNIIKELKQLNCFRTHKIFFIRNHINKRLREQIKYLPELAMFQLLSILSYVNLDYIYLIKNNKINENLLNNLIWHYIDSIQDIRINDFNLFSLYSMCLKDRQEAEHIEKLIDNSDFDLEFKPFEIWLFKHAIKNIQSKNKNNETLFFKNLYSLYTSEKNINEVIQELITTVNLENNEYKLKLKNSREKPINENITLPLPTLNFTNEENLTLFFKKHTSTNFPIYLGNKNNSLFKKNNLNLNIEEAKENKLFIASCGSGKTEAIINLLFQYILNNKSVLYFEEQMDIAIIHKLYQATLISGRVNDFCYFFINENNLKQKIISAYKNNKIIVLIPFSRFENKEQHQNSLKEIIDSIQVITKIHDNKKTQYLSDVIYISFYSTLYFNKKTSYYYLIEDLKMTLKTSKICFISSAQDYQCIRNEELLSLFKLHFIMRYEDTGFLEDLNFKDFDAQELRFYRPGQFSLFKYENQIFKPLNENYFFKYLDFKNLFSTIILNPSSFSSNNT